MVFTALCSLVRQVKEHKRHQDGDPPLLIEGGTDPALDVGGDRMIVTATRGEAILPM